MLMKRDVEGTNNPDNNYYALMPRSLLVGKYSNGKRLGMGARVLLVLLLSYRSLPRILVSQRKMARQIGVSRQTISKYLKELKNAGLITSHRTGSTCIIKFTSVVNLSIQRCKAQFTQVTNNRNEKEKLYMTPKKKFNPLTAKDKIGQYNEFDF